MYTIDELEIIKSALEQDIIHQEKQLETINDIRFEMWLYETKDLHKKVALQLIDLKSKQK